MLASLTPRADILEVISNLSSDEVFTPPPVANAVLDLLPEEVWSDPSLRWLDPGTKTGVFLREAARRLMEGLEGEIPDEAKRREHILNNMLFGAAITELTALMARRSLYCSKEANGDMSVAQLSTPEGNIFLEEVRHSYDRAGRCTECGGSKGQLERGDNRENYAYAFIHEDGRRKMSEVMDMQFDVIVGNPPYQMLDGGGSGSSAQPIYNHFVDAAIALDPKHVAMIVPSRWLAGGKGLDEFRSRLLSDRRVSTLVDYQDAGSLFPGINLNGGACYFHWDAAHDGTCAVTTVHKSGEKSTLDRDLDEHDVFVRLNEALPIVRKVEAKREERFTDLVSARNVFGLSSGRSGSKRKTPSAGIKLYGLRTVSWISRDELRAGDNLVDEHKVFITKASDGNEIYPLPVLTEPIVAGPGTACTETYLVIGPFANAEIAENCAKYLKTRFFRFLLSLRKITQNNSRDKFAFVPIVDLSKVWTDQMLYKRYGITAEEQEFITKTIREMPE